MHSLLSAPYAPLPIHWTDGWSPSPLARSAGAAACIAVSLLGCFLALRNSRLARVQPGDAKLADRTAALWLFLAMALGFLGVARLFDIATLATSLGRQFAIRDGWYQHRRPLQFAVICVLGMIAISLVGRFKIKVHGQEPALRSALLGLVIYASFGAIRACSWHYLDWFLAKQWHGVHVSAFLELSCGIFVAWSISQSALARAGSGFASEALKSR